MDEFHSIIHEGADAARIFNSNGELLHDAPTDENNGRPEVLRGDLRQILIDSLPNETIEWNKKSGSCRRIGKRTIPSVL